MNSAHLRPVEDAIGQPMLQIAEAGGTRQTSKRGVTRRALILRIVHHEFDGRIASGCGEGRGGLKQAVGDGVSEVCPADIPHRGLNGG